MKLTPKRQEFFAVLLLAICTIYFGGRTVFEFKHFQSDVTEYKKTHKPMNAWKIVK